MANAAWSRTCFVGPRSTPAGTSSQTCCSSEGSDAEPMKKAVLFVAIAMASSCTRTRTLTIAWDAPAVVPDLYRVFVDDHIMLEIPPPPVDRGCGCLKVAVPVPRGRHTIQVVAYNGSGASPPSTVLVAQ